MVEGGNHVLNSILGTLKSDFVIVTIAPRLLGTGVSALTTLPRGPSQISGCAISIRNAQWTVVGQDIVLSGYPHEVEQNRDSAST